MYKIDRRGVGRAGGGVQKSLFRTDLKYLYMHDSTVFQIKKRKRQSVRCAKCERSFVNEYSLRVHLSYFKVILGGLSEIVKFDFVHAMIYLNYYLRLY